MVVIYKIMEVLQKELIRYVTRRSGLFMPYFILEINNADNLDCHSDMHKG